jgi:GT2 family glycosyltransferase
MKNDNDKVAYVIVCWNNADLLADCIDSITSQDHRNSIIILVDNASTDDSVSVTKTNYPEVIVLEQQKNLGFAKGNNVGIEKAMEDPMVKQIALLCTSGQ